MKADLLIKNGMVYAGGRFEPADIGVVGEKIAFYAERGSQAEADRVIDATRKYVLPGMIDFHCHIREPAWKKRKIMRAAQKRLPMAASPPYVSCRTT